MSFKNVSQFNQNANIKFPTKIVNPTSDLTLSCQYQPAFSKIIFTIDYQNNLILHSGIGPI